MTPRPRKLALGALTLALACAAAFPQEPAPPPGEASFLGLSWEFNATPGSESSGSIIVPEGLGLSVSWGDARFVSWPRVRGRAGLSWWAERPFRVFAGTELALFERLNAYSAKAFGIYAQLDGVASFDADGPVLSVRPSAKLLIPLSSVGGIAVGAGWDSKLGPLLHLDIMNGAYMMPTPRVAR
ncbi:MAG: hypothetical protein JXA15_05420 [Spirochaetales bacterium]|nr:hypothetical protein [Spirochaetales bacterium]